MNKIFKSTLLNPAWDRRLMYPLMASIMAYALFAVPGFALVAAVWLGVALTLGSMICLGLCLCAYSFWLQGHGPQGEHLKEAIVDLITSPEYLYLCSMITAAIAGCLFACHENLAIECFDFSRQFWWWLDGGGEGIRS